jgi:integrase
MLAPLRDFCAIFHRFQQPCRHILWLPSTLRRGLDTVQQHPSDRPSLRLRAILSSSAMNRTLQRMTADTVTVHGFRSSFRDWASNETHYPRDLIETALAHVIGDKAEQAYRRSDALEKRRKLMEAWASYCEPKANSKVLQLRKE